MQKFIYKRQGAISIFLVIVLLPMLTIGCVMVDLSRIQLARSVASAAGDLSLNTGLTCYDNVLKDMYGLFAVSQDYDTLMGNLEAYYKNSLTAAGLSDKDSDNYVKQIMNYLEGIDTVGEVTDLFQIQVNSFDNPVNEKASLINTALTKSQIINFMKYRGPIDMGLGFLDSLKSFTTVGDQMAVIENRKKYYDEQEKVISECEEVWKAFYEYNKLKIKQNDFEVMADNLDKYEGEYEFINKNIIRDYYKSEKNFKEADHTYASGNSGKYTFIYKGSDVKIGKQSASSYEALTKYAQSVKDAIDSYNKGKNNEEVKKLYIDEKNNIYEIQRVLQYRRSIGSSESYGDLGKDVYTAYEKYQSAKQAVQSKIDSLESDIESLRDTKENLSDFLTPEEKKAIIAEINKEIEEKNKEKEEKEKWLADIKKEWDTSLDSSYEKVMSEFAEMTGRIKGKKGTMLETINGVSKIVCNGESDTYNNGDLVEGGISTAKAENISKDISGFYEAVCAGIGFLEKARASLGIVEKAVSEGGTLVNAEKDWKTSAEADSINGMSIAEQNLAEADSVHEFINKEDVAELLAHIDGAVESLNKAKTEIEEYKYGTAMIKDIENIDEALSSIEAAGLTEGLENVSIKLTELDKKVDEVFKSAYAKSPAGLTDEWTDIKKDHPEIEIEGKDGHKFYAFLKNNFEAVTSEDKSYEKEKSNKDSELSGTEKKLNNFTEDNKPKEDTGEKFSFSGDNLPSAQWPDIKAKIEAENKTNAEEGESSGEDPLAGSLEANADGNLSTGLNDMFSKLGSMLADMGVVLRDDLFIASYAMNMFTYDTLEKEAVWEANGSNPKLSAVKESIGEVKGFNIDGRLVKSMAYDADGNIILEGEAKNAQSELMTMTNVPLSPQNNVAYLSEVEYMTFGSGGTNTAYTAIYGIRFAFNAIYAFSESTIREGARGIAMAIFGTPPLTFLVPIAQAAIIIGVALAESALDLACLQAGMAVPIYKTKKTWLLSFENLFGTAKDILLDTALEKAEEKLGQTIDSSITALNDWLDKTGEELKNSAGEEINNLKGAVEDAIKATAEQYAGTAVDQLIALCRKVKTLKSAGQLEGNEVEYIKEALESWIKDGTDIKDSVIYMAKKGAVNIIISNGYIQEMLEQIEKVADDTEATLKEYNMFVNKIITNINLTFTKGDNAIRQYIEKAKEGVKDAAKQGTDKLKESIGGVIDGLGDKYSSGTKTDANVGVVSSLYSFQYSDYLRLFLLIGLVANQEKTLMRLEDVVQVNMDNQKEGFELKKSYTYLELDTTLEVKPLFMKLPFMPEDTEDLINNNKNWYTIKYKAIQGY